jgi:hypothetical protein
MVETDALDGVLRGVLL